MDGRGHARSATTDEAKVALGLWQGPSDNALVATALLSHLTERGKPAR
jgi:hypothetical protein